jgi:hypothetical protein
MTVPRLAATAQTLSTPPCCHVPGDREYMTGCGQAEGGLKAGGFGPSTDV